MTYTYDGDGNRVEKSNGRLFWYGMGSEVLERTSLTGTTPVDYIFFDGQRVGSRNPSSTVIYLNDHLGSNRISAGVATGGSTAAVQWDADYYPFGRIKTFTDTSGPTFRFTGKELDSETGLDNFGARYYSSNLGRFMIADWSSVPAPVPYANLTNPQTLNLYAMVSDNPETFADLDGHGCNGVVPGDHNCAPGQAPSKTATQGDGQTTGDGTKKSISQRAQKLAQKLADDYKKIGQEIKNAARTTGKSIGTALSNPNTIAGFQIALAMETDGASDLVETVLGEAAGSEGVALPTEESQLGHIFREAEGHLADTPANRQLLTDVANDAKSVLGKDKFGNTWSARTLSDGTQVWTESRGGRIINGGLNKTPRVFNPSTGLSGQ